MKLFTPEELKQYHKGKYDKWKFAKNRNGEWIGVYKNKSASIITKIDSNGIEYPDLEIRELTSTGGFGLSVWWQAYKNSKK